jgi:hypothetical protein
MASQGETVEEAEANLKEACELYLESAREFGILDKILEEVTGGGREATALRITSSSSAPFIEYIGVTTSKLICLSFR